MYTMQRLSAAIQDFLSDLVRGEDVVIPGGWFLASSILIIARKSASFSNLPVMQAEMSA